MPADALLSEASLSAARCLLPAHLDHLAVPAVKRALTIRPVHRQWKQLMPVVIHDQVLYPLLML